MASPEGPIDSESVEKEPSRSEIFEGFVTEAEYARQRGVSLRTCQRDRALRRAPPHVILGNRVFYRIDAVRAWLNAQERDAARGARSRRTGNQR